MKQAFTTDDLLLHHKVMCIHGLDDAPFGLCSTREGVDFRITLDNGERIPCVITKAALQCDYGASGESPASWLAAFVDHRQHIDDRILAAMAGRGAIDGVLFDHAGGASRIFMRPASTRPARATRRWP